MKKIYIILVLFSVFTYGQDYDNGKSLFNQHCAACHKMDKRLVGPPLQDVVELQGKDWTKEWIKNSKALIDAGDPHAVEIWEEYNKAAMPAYNFLQDKELDDIVEYLASYKAKKAEAATVIAPVAAEGGQVVVNNTPTPTYVYVLFVICLVVLLIAVYVFYVGLKTIINLTEKTQTTNLYLMKRLNMDQNRVDGEISTLIKKEVKNKLNKKIKDLKKEVNDQLKNFD